MKKTFFIAVLALTGLASCRKNDTPATITVENKPSSRLYVLNEGNQNENRASLDYLDLDADTYYQNFYYSVNNKNLGDLGNDIQIYGGKIYIVVNLSNKVEILDANTAQSLGQVTIKNCRSVTFANGKAYVSAYNRYIPTNGFSDTDPAKGIVAEIDTSTLTITRTVVVGRQPEGLIALNNKLYVANSGGYNPDDYEKTVSVIDLSTFTLLKDIPVAINLSAVKADAENNLYISSPGDYNTTPARLFVLNTLSEKVTDTFDISGNRFDIANDTAYVLDSRYDANWALTNSYIKIDCKTKKIISENLITDGTGSNIQTPYGIIVDVYNGDFYISDALDYQSAGTIYRYGRDGVLKKKYTAGQIPGHFAFLKK